MAAAALRAKEELNELRAAVESVEKRVCAPLGDANFSGSSSEQLLRMKYNALLIRVQIAERTEARLTRGGPWPGECPVCMTDLKDDPSEVSQLLPCRHVICTGCREQLDRVRRKDRDAQVHVYKRHKKEKAIIWRGHWRTCPICRSPAPFERKVKKGAHILKLSSEARLEMALFTKEFGARHPVMTQAAAVHRAHEERMGE